tara:strand:+ start:1134 stop:1286 length:153 start_codon:yes stop_codon:yes gene_type:complete
MRYNRIISDLYNKNIDRIVNYCEKDTLAVAQILLRFNNEKLLTETDVVRV